MGYRMQSVEHGRQVEQYVQANRNYIGDVAKEYAASRHKPRHSGHQDELAEYQHGDEDGGPGDASFDQQHDRQHGQGHQHVHERHRDRDDRQHRWRQPRLKQQVPLCQQRTCGGADADSEPCPCDQAREDENREVLDSQVQHRPEDEHKHRQLRKLPDYGPCPSEYRHPVGRVDFTLDEMEHQLSEEARVKLLRPRAVKSRSRLMKPQVRAPRCILGASVVRNLAHSVEKSRVMAPAQRTWPIDAPPSGGAEIHPPRFSGRATEVRTAPHDNVPAL